jgi:hypothetical protein
MVTATTIGAAAAFFASALPEADFRYFSNSNACFSSEIARYVLSRQGEYLEVWKTTFALCLAIRDFRSLVTPALGSVLNKGILFLAWM